MLKFCKPGSSSSFFRWNVANVANDSVARALGDAREGASTGELIVSRVWILSSEGGTEGASA